MAISLTFDRKPKRGTQTTTTKNSIHSECKRNENESTNNELRAAIVQKNQNLMKPLR